MGARHPLFSFAPTFIFHHFFLNGRGDVRIRVRNHKSQIAHLKPRGQLCPERCYIKL